VHVDAPPNADIQALKARIADLEKQLAAKSEAPKPKAERYSGPKKLYRVSLEAHIKGFLTPSPWFAAEFPAIEELTDAAGKVIREARAADARGLPIEAWDEEEARSIFRRMHGIEGGPMPEVIELTEDEGREAMQRATDASEAAMKKIRPAPAGRAKESSAERRARLEGEEAEKLAARRRAQASSVG